MQAFSPLWAVVVALIPAAFARWSARELIPLVDDPALAERLVASRTRTSLTFAACFLATAVLAPRHAVWTLPLLTVANAAARYGLRKVLYRETWSLPEYLFFFTRLVIAAFGFWLLLAITPLIIECAAPNHWIAAAIAAVVLLAWNENHTRILCAIVGAKPITDAATVARFEQLIAACGLRQVDLKVIDMRGGAFANAFALASIKQPTVLTTSTLLDRLNADETAAIFAHELAHIEHFNIRRLRLMRIASLTLIALAVLISPAMHRYASSVAAIAPAIWPIVLVFSAAIRLGHRQRHETESDLRALALLERSAPGIQHVPPAQALIDALVKLHTFARLPRRLDLRAEQQATHPSLARRIQAIRAAGGATAATLDEAAQFTAANGVASVTFLDNRLSWSEGAASNHSIEYGRLKMLRVDARRSHEARLIAVDIESRRWEMALRREDVARAQATLDIVDARLGNSTIQSPAVPHTVARLFALIGLLLAAAKGQVALAVVAWIVVIVPVTALTSAAAAASLAAAAQIVQAGGTAANGGLLIAIAVAICGASLIGVAFLNRREADRPWAATVVGAFAILGGLSWIAVLLSGVSTAALYRSLHAWPFATAMSLAAAGGLLFDGRRSHRILAIAAACIGLAGTILASSSFVERFSGDPFFTHANQANRSVLDLDVPFATATTSFDASTLYLSSDGSHAAAITEDDEETVHVQAGAVGGALTTFDADDARFVNETQLLLLRRERTAATLTLVDLASGGREVWKAEFAARNAQLSWHRERREWSLLGWTDRRDGGGGVTDVVRYEGTASGPASRQRRWPQPWKSSNVVELLGVSDRHLATVEQEWTMPSFARRFPRFAALLAVRGHRNARFWTLTDDGAAKAWLTSELDVTCFAAFPNAGVVPCSAFDGVSTRVFEVDSIHERLLPIAAIDGRFYPRAMADERWLFGWAGGTSVLVDTSTGSMMRLRSDGGIFANAVAISADRIAVASSGKNGAIIRFYNR